jgi:hypothetical protein
MLATRNYIIPQVGKITQNYPPLIQCDDTKQTSAIGKIPIALIFKQMLKLIIWGKSEVRIFWTGIR